jgi:hypothetical protein
MDEKAEMFLDIGWGERHVCPSCAETKAQLPVETTEEKVARVRFEMQQPEWEENRIDVAILNFMTLLGYTDKQIFGKPGKPK